MTEPQLADVRRRVRDDIDVGPAPVHDLVCRSRQSRRRHRLAVVGGAVSAVALVVGGGLAMRPAPEPTSFPAAVADRPTGTILFAGSEREGNNSDIFMAPTDGSPVKRLTTYPGTWRDLDFVR